MYICIWSTFLIFQWVLQGMIGTCYCLLFQIRQFREMLLYSPVHCKLYPYLALACRLVLTSVHGHRFWWWSANITGIFHKMGLAKSAYQGLAWPHVTKAEIYIYKSKCIYTYTVCINSEDRLAVVVHWQQKYIYYFTRLLLVLYIIWTCGDMVLFSPNSGGLHQILVAMETVVHMCERTL